MPWSTFSPSPTELAYVNEIFSVADPTKLGIVTGDAAVSLFAGSDLPPDILGAIWHISDHDSNGFLGKKGVAAAVRLIGWAQVGESVTEALLDKSGPLPTIKGIRTPKLGPRTLSPGPNQSPKSALPPLGPDDRAKFLRLFVSCGPSGGLISGDKARDVFLKSRLPVDKLGQIWSLADTHNRGALDSTDFAIGMHLIQASMASQITTIPAILPAGLYEQASGGKPLAIGTHVTGNSVPSPRPSSAFSDSHAVKPQYTGQAVTPQYTGMSHPGPRPSGGSVAPLSAAQTAFPLTASNTAWGVSSEEKAKSDSFFDTLDPHRRGFIEGDVAVPFMLESKLSEQLLAHIWDLADLSNDGRLTRDGFAVAMHLINQKLAGHEVPQTLPSNLVPPRDSAKIPATNSEVQNDLWLLEDDTPLATLLPNSPTIVGQASAPKSALAPTQAKPPINTSPFGNSTGPANRNFLDDDEPDTASTTLTSSVAIGNARNQLDSTNRSLATNQAERRATESSVSQTAAQLAQLESQLAAARAAHDTETRLLNDLRERSSQQSARIKTTTEELIRAESDLSALRAEKAEVEGAVLRDKEEVRDIQRKMKTTTEDIAALKSELEILKKDARQQKGLVSISKKQLGNIETDKAQVVQALDAQKSETLASAEQERVASPIQSNTPAAVPLPETPERMASPVSPISTKSNNPFGRLAQGLGSSPSTPQPFTLPLVNAEPSAPASQDLDADPFGFSSQVEESESHHADTPLNEEQVARASTPPAAIFATQTTSESGAVDTESSPPLPLAGAEAIPSLASHFPAIEDVGSGQDLPPLKEIDRVDDDSSDDDADDGDNKATLTSPTQDQGAPSELSPVHSPTPLNGATTQFPTLAKVSSPFDNVFGTDSVTNPTPISVLPPPPGVPRSSSPGSRRRSPAPPVPPRSSSPSRRDIIGAPTIETVLEPNGQAVGTISDFDQAFGSVAGPPSAAPREEASKPFEFQSAFDDNFDFSPPPFTTPFTQNQTATAPSTATEPSQNGRTSSSPFDSFAAGALTAQATQTPQTSNGTSSGFSHAFATTPMSFDDTFGSSSGGTDFSPPSSAPPPPSLTPSTRAKVEVPTQASPAAPALPKRPTSPQYGSLRGRPASPPPRTASPKPETPAPASRTSKLNLHFPFGKNKNKNKLPSSPKKSSSDERQGERNGGASSLQSSVTAAPADIIGSPGPDEDVESVKALVNMGFTRDQVVTALERHSYDVPKALNSLLGSG